MKKYALVEDQKTKICSVGIGTDENYYKSIGFKLMEVEQAYNGNWYLAGYAPEKPVEVKQTEVRKDRDDKLNGIFWRVERYQTQKEAEIQTTDDKSTYSDILFYLQYLRDYPEQKNAWWEQNALTFDEWQKNA